MIGQRGGFVLGLVVGLLVGLAIALGVALYITGAPVPFKNKVPQRSAEQDAAEAERNKNWDPNAALGGKSAAKPATAQASGAVATVTVPGTPPAPAAGPAAAPASAASPGRDPAAILAGSPAPAAAATPAAEAFVYFVQAGAYTRTEEAEQQRAKLAIIGYAAKITEREQSGRTVYRVRVGPYDTREEAEATQARLTDGKIDARLVRVEKP